MDAATQDFCDLLERARQRCDHAVRTLIGRYQAHVFRAVYRHWNRRLAPRLDAADLVQEVWEAFFTRAIHVHRFDRPEQLIAFLTTLARNRVLKAIRHHVQAQKSALGHEQLLSEFGAGGEAVLVVPTRSPAQAALDEDQWDHLLAGQSPPARHILALLRQGYTRAEIADDLGVNASIVRRVLERAVGVAQRG